MIIRVSDVIHYLVDHTKPIKPTVDTLKFGHNDEQVNGIAVSFMPTYETIEQTIKKQANVLITHEGLFYSHFDRPISKNDRVSQAKKQLINESQLNIFRLHDYIHHDQPDQMTASLIRKLEWENYLTENERVASILSIPEQPLNKIITHIKQKLNLGTIRYSGDLEQTCQSIGVFVGFRGGSEQTIPLINKYALDLVIYGEGPEWETPEYIRDSLYIKKKNALIVLGHLESEEPGMKELAHRLSGNFPEVPVHFIPNRPCLNLY